ncbi:DUF3854 domain-containing protein [Microcoleus sp. FACHB-1515]|uniref:plasmid replication protein, CyRepA1 family n=1 Tax=Cyanophyceae TaxID=3028117 RepID=UPI0016852A3B|nr:plasmid replication protein, CyRepA1 family [Microcoleus sp. FACHB-1515]MBD2090670.1 DUF3854 domain-containing protein [Microcoleus sp. FACHB-1515]
MSAHRLADKGNNFGSRLNHSTAAPVLVLPQINPRWFGKADTDHAQEWLDSGVDPGIIALNVETLVDTAIDGYADYLFPIAERLHWNLSRFGQKTRPYLRGWWVSGIDPLNDWQRMEWGRFKPDAATPILDREKGKPAKYLSPSLGAGSSRLVLLDVPQAVWDKVAQRYQIPISDLDRSLGFWQWVWKQNIPLVLTEGEKKAGCLLTQGYAAIALPGIFNGYRRETRSLIDELAHFATPKRSISICFDYETKAKVLKNIAIATTKLGKLLDRAECVVNVITLPGPEKGVDDFIVAQGAQSFDTCYDAALALEFWLASKLWALTHTPTLTLNTPYLNDLPYPSSGLACIKSAKGTGKTTALQSLIQAATGVGRKVLVITHRIQLGRAICDSIGIDWIEEVKASETQGLFGYGLCIDSLHATSQARFTPEFWKGAIVILDEVEQVLWHALNSSTCYDHRIKILEALRELVQVVIGSGGLIIAQDADLSNVSIDYLKGLVETPIDPWVVVNQWQPETNWAVSFYDTKNPAPLVAYMEKFLAQGAVFVALDSQKVSGRWSSKNLETYLRNRFPDKRILRLDSESVADPKHPAYSIVEQLNRAITKYDIVLATPTIGTGVSIDVRGHFKAVFGIFQGVTPDTESRQALARVREPVPRFIWAARFGPGKVGNGSCSYQDVVHSTTKAVKYNVALLKDIDFDIDAQTDPITLRTWAKMAARVNVSLWNYRSELRNGLMLEGHQVTTVTDDLRQLLPPAFQSLCAELTELLGQEAIDQALHADLHSGILQFPGVEWLAWQHDREIAETVTQSVKAIQEHSQLVEAEAIATATDLTSSEYKTLKDQRAKTAVERYAQHKHELQRRYPIPITPELKLKDDAGWYAQLRLHYYLTHDSTLVRLRDLKEWQGHLDRGDGKIALQDVRLLTMQVETLKALGLLDLLDPERQVRAIDADVDRIRQQALQYSHDLKTVLNLTVSAKMSPIEIVQALLGKLGLRLTCVGRDVAADGRRGGPRIYQYQPSNDGRETIFAEWQQRDADALDSSIATLDRAATLPPTSTTDPPPDKFIASRSADGLALEAAREERLACEEWGSLEKQDCSAIAQVGAASQYNSAIQVGCVVRHLQQACRWVVVQVEAATARLRHLHRAQECTLPLNELVAIAIEAGGEPDAPTPVG